MWDPHPNIQIKYETHFKGRVAEPQGSIWVNKKNTQVSMGCTLYYSVPLQLSGDDVMCYEGEV